jgi:23S rRNA A1618 N6-methylase RlmF
MVRALTCALLRRQTPVLDLSISNNALAPTVPVMFALLQLLMPLLEANASALVCLVF